ncbi:MAG: hypothetical protein HYR83_10360 [Planctomycetes bacterium]|nr:hypothetical protein [Planctomycetota bacterium]
MAIYGDRLYMLDEIHQLSTGATTLRQLASFTPTSTATAVDRIQDFAFGPLYVLDGVLILELIRSELGIARLDVWSKIQDLKQDDEKWKHDIDEMMFHPLLKFSQPRRYAFLSIFFRIRATRHMAATALAIRLYQLDHDGQRPRGLVELVPDYLPSMPIDPFADGKPLGYRPDTEPPYLYTVFEDGIDQGGIYSLYPNGTVVRTSLDCPFFLTPNPKREQYLREEEAREAEEESKKREAESHEAGDNNPNEKASGGQGDKDQQAR